MKNKKVLTIILIVSVIFVLGIAGTYAWYVWSSEEEDTTRIVTSVGAATVLYDAGPNLIGQNIRPVSDKTSGIIKNLNVSTSDDTTNKISFNLYLDIDVLDTGLKHESFKYELYRGDTLVSDGNFSQEYLTSLADEEQYVSCEKNGTNHIILLSDETISTTVTTYTLYLWIDGVNYANPETMQNQNFSFKLHADGQNALIQESLYPDVTAPIEGTLAHQIVSTYDSSSKTLVTSGGYRYYYDTTNNLMADIAGNVRYYGASPDNYIYFNCDDYNNQTANTCEKWRIIGVFGDKVKIVRNGVLGSYAWDFRYGSDQNSTTYSNNWHESSLNKLLNISYYNNDDNVVSHWLTAADGDVSSKVTNFSSSNIGIKNDETRNRIANTTWFLGGFTKNMGYVNQVYSIERLVDDNLSWIGKIGLIYPSDYGYSADLSQCSNITLRYYNDAKCADNSWISLLGAQWLLSSFTTQNYFSSYLFATKYVDRTYVYSQKNVYPTLYLTADTVISGGLGTSSSPYKIGV